MGRLEGKIAVVTGASSGMGQAITRLYAAEGAKVVAAARRKDRIEALAAEAAKSGGIVEPYAADMFKTEDVEGMVDFAVEKFGRIDILVNCAGILDGFTTLANMKQETWENVLRVNLTAPMEASSRALGYMLKQESGGVIVNVASIGGLRGAGGGAAYVTSKHGLVGLTKNVAFTYADQKIRCNAICPGGVETEIAANLDPAKIDMLGMGKTQLINTTNPRNGKAYEVAAVALFLASDEAGFVNGVAMPVDAGWCAG